MVKILRYLRKREIGFVIISIVLICTQVWLDLKLPDMMNRVVRLLMIPSGDNVREILKSGGKMLACALSSMALAMCVGYFAARVAGGMSKRLRSLIFDKVGNFSMEEINNFSTSSLITRSTNDVTQVQMLIAIGMQVLIKAPITAVWAITKMSAKQWQWTASAAVAVVLMIIMFTFMIVFALPKFRSIQGLTDNLNRVARENLTGIRVVRAYNAENYQQERFDTANRELTGTHLYTSRLMALMSPFMTVIMSGLPFAVYWIGAHLVNNTSDIKVKGELMGNMMVFTSYAMQTVMAFMMLMIIFVILPRTIVSAKRINEVLDTTPNIISGKHKSADLSGEVEFKNVSFAFPDAEEYVLKDISFKANKGEVVALIGSTGSGKSTAVNLIPRFYDATKGEILVNGINVKDYDTEALNDKIGFITQQAVIFSGTVRSNVDYGGNCGSDEEIWKALDIAQAKNFVENLPEKLDAPISQGGTNLSGGQKQRISIARAICKKPEIYIFDDSFSALDYKTDRILRTRLAEETKGATKLIVAQRIGTIKDADKIIVLDEGEIVGIGKYRDLLKSCEVFKEIALSQLSEEELENE